MLGNKKSKYKTLGVLILPSSSSSKVWCQSYPGCQSWPLTVGVHRDQGSQTESKLSKSQVWVCQGHPHPQRHHPPWWAPVVLQTQSHTNSSSGMRSSVWLLVSSSSSCSSQHVSFKFIITPITIILRYFNICCCCPVYCCSNLIVISSFLKTFFILSAYLSTAAAALGRIFEVTRLFDWWGGGCGITGICVNPHIWTFDSCSRAGMDMSSWDWWGWRRVMTDSQTWKKLESQRCQNTGCGGWLGWARQTLEYQVTDKTNQCLPKHSNISDSILLNVKASSHSM